MGFRVSGALAAQVRWQIPETYDNRVGFIYDQETGMPSSALIPFVEFRGSGFRV